MGTTRSYRFRSYTCPPMGETTFAAASVSGDDADCGAASGEQVEKTDTDRWIADTSATPGTVATGGQWRTTRSRSRATGSNPKSYRPDNKPGSLSCDGRYEYAPVVRVFLCARRRSHTVRRS